MDRKGDEDTMLKKPKRKLGFLSGKIHYKKRYVMKCPNCEQYRLRQSMNPKNFYCQNCHSYFELKLIRRV